MRQVRNGNFKHCSKCGSGGQEKTKFARFIPLHIPLPKQLKPSALKAARFLSTIVEEPPDSVADPLND
jgi:hypothetical protein